MAGLQRIVGSGFLLRQPAPAGGLFVVSGALGASFRHGCAILAMLAASAPSRALLPGLRVSAALVVGLFRRLSRRTLAALAAAGHRNLH